MLMSAGLIGVFVADMRSRQVRDVRLFAHVNAGRILTHFGACRRSNSDPPYCPEIRSGRLVEVVHRRDPRARGATLTSLAKRRAGGACAPTWASSAHADDGTLFSTASGFSKPARRLSLSR
jgi:hypothetical protein